MDCHRTCNTDLSGLLIYNRFTPMTFLPVCSYVTVVSGGNERGLEGGTPDRQTYLSVRCAQELTYRFHYIAVIVRGLNCNTRTKTDPAFEFPGRFDQGGLTAPAESGIAFHHRNGFKTDHVHDLGHINTGLQQVDGGG